MKQMRLIPLILLLVLTILACTISGNRATTGNQGENEAADDNGNSDAEEEVAEATSTTAADNNGNEAAATNTPLPSPSPTHNGTVENGDSTKEQPVFDVDGNIIGVVFLPDQSTLHDDSLHYEFGKLPPAGGVHNPIWQNCGIYAEPVLPEHAIHSLEHGAVWITYQPDLDADSIANLQKLARGQTHVLVSPYPNQSSPVVLSAWERQLVLDSAYDPRIQPFLAQFVAGSQSPEPGVTCAGGLGNPLP